MEGEAAGHRCCSVLLESRRMGVLSFFRRHWYHYTILTGTYAFYPFERWTVNVFFVLLSGLTGFTLSQLAMAIGKAIASSSSHDL